MKPGQIHEALKARQFYDERIRTILPEADDATVAAFHSLIFEAQSHCYSCGEHRSADCFTCERLWRS